MEHTKWRYAGLTDNGSFRGYQTRCSIDLKGILRQQGLTDKVGKCREETRKIEIHTFKINKKVFKLLIHFIFVYAL